MSAFFPEDPSRWAPVTGTVRLATYQRGRGEPLVLINGLGASAHDWGPIVEILARKRRLVAFDNRGAGRSEVPDVPMSLEELADDASSVFEAYGLESADVVGYSMGGMIAQILAADRPELIRRLVLMATHPGARSAVRSLPRARAVMSPTDDQPRATVVRMQYEAFVAPGFLHRRPDEFERMLSVRMSHLAPLYAWRRQLQAVKESERADLVGRIRASTLVIHGVDDPLIPIENGEMLHELIPDSRFVAVPECGHMLNWEKPEEVAQAVDDFLSSD